jgi:hypothetical protein
LKNAWRPVVVTLFAATLVALIAFAMRDVVADGTPETASDAALLDTPVPADATAAIPGKQSPGAAPSASTDPDDLRLPLPDGMTIRAYTETSPWNTKIPADPVLDRKSAAWIKDVGPLTANVSSFTFPVYAVRGHSTDKVTYTASGIAAVISADGASQTRPADGQIDIPMPEGAVAATGSDGQIIVLDLDTGDEYDLWQVDTDARTATNITKFTRGLLSPGTTSVVYPSRGAGMVYYRGLIRPWEIEQGRIDHALAFAYYRVSNEFRYPATKSDGTKQGMPEGARIQLDPSFDVNSLPDRTARIVARALQEYGAYVVDYAGNRGKIYAEYDGTANWSADSASTRFWSSDVVSSIPAGKLRVLRQWDGT